MIKWLLSLFQHDPIWGSALSESYVAMHTNEPTIYDLPRETFMSVESIKAKMRQKQGLPVVAVSTAPPSTDGVKITLDVKEETPRPSKPIKPPKGPTPPKAKKLPKNIPTPFRFPDGTNLNTTYRAEDEMWVSTLTIPGVCDLRMVRSSLEGILRKFAQRWREEYLGKTFDAQGKVIE